MLNQILEHFLVSYKPEQTYNIPLGLSYLKFMAKDDNREKVELDMDFLKNHIPISATPYISHVLNNYIKTIDATIIEKYGKDKNMNNVMNFYKQKIDDKDVKQYHIVNNFHNLLNFYRQSSMDDKLNIQYLNIDNLDDFNFHKLLHNYLDEVSIRDGKEIVRHEDGKVKLFENGYGNPIYNNSNSIPIESIVRNYSNNFENNNDSYNKRDHYNRKNNYNIYKTPINNISPEECAKRYEEKNLF